MSRILHSLLLFTLLLCCAPSVVSQRTNTQKLKTEQQKAKKEIRDNSRKLESNKREIKRQMNRIRTLGNEIGARDNEIVELESNVSRLNAGIALTRAQIDSLTNEIAALRAAYRKMLRNQQALKPATSPLEWMLRSRSLAELSDRLRYTRRIRRYRQEREQQIAVACRKLGLKRDELSAKINERTTALEHLTTSRKELESKRNEADRVVGQLKKEGVNLQSAIAERRRQLARLDSELNRIIEADRAARREKARREADAKKRKEAKNAQAADTKKETPKTAPAKSPAELRIAEADRKLTGDFESNRGRLLFPVSGKYRVVRGFGRSQYSDKVQTSHVGIDIEVPKGTRARAIFEGAVTNVSHLDGFHTIVVVRHGLYLTVYVNLENVTVRAGQSLKAGQAIGTVAPDDGGNAILQFGLRKERQELNPLQWVK